MRTQPTLRSEALRCWVQDRLRRLGLRMKEEIMLSLARNHYNNILLETKLLLQYAQVRREPNLIAVVSEIYKMIKLIDERLDKKEVKECRK
mgnify:CR=1 FL=1